MEPTSPVVKRRQRGEDRVPSACDLCKQRKVKCDGNTPCAYCTRKLRPALCTFSASKPRQRTQEHEPQTLLVEPAPPASNQAAVNSSRGPNELPERSYEHDDNRDTAVPRDARLLRDDEDKVTFIGDCAPLSFLQTIRQLVATKVHGEGLPSQLSRDSIIEVASICEVDALLPHTNESEVRSAISAFQDATIGLIDMFDTAELERDMTAWVIQDKCSLEPKIFASQLPIFLLVIAIYHQNDPQSESGAETYFREAKALLMDKLGSSSNNMTLENVQGFVLVALYMLRASQPNAAYMHFGLAARCGYAIGLHRTEVNASFGPDLRVVRDQTWKSLRIVDMLLSHILGRPTCTADIDCTVVYEDHSQSVSHLHASVQMFLVLERIVMEVYSRKRISLRTANFITRQFRSWSSRWLTIFNAVLDDDDSARLQVIGACHCLCTYYYGIMLLTRPFLVQQLYEYLGTLVKPQGTQADNKEKMKFADAALEAAARFVETLEISKKEFYAQLRMPMIVSWLFTTALVLCVGIMGRNGLSYDHDCRTAISCLDHFAVHDPHARQYAKIHLRLQRKRLTAVTFGFTVREQPSSVDEDRTGTMEPISLSTGQERLHDPNTHDHADMSVDNTDLFALPWLSEDDPALLDFLQPDRDGVPDSFADVPLFPLDQHPTLPW